MRAASDPFARANGIQTQGLLILADGVELLGQCIHREHFQKESVDYGRIVLSKKTNPDALEQLQGPQKFVAAYLPRSVRSNPSYHCLILLGFKLHMLCNG